MTGGVSGIGAIVYYATRFPISYTYFLINGLLLIVGLKILGWKFLTKTIYAILMLTFLLGLAQEIIPKDPSGNFVKILGEGQDFMSLVIGCMMTGSALAIVFLNNGSTGGTDIIAASVNKFRNVSLGTVLTFVDLIIIGSCLFIPQFGDLMERIHKIVFGFCTMVIENFMLDYVMNRRRQSVAGDSQRPRHEDRPRRDHPRRPRLVHRSGAQGHLSAGPQERVDLHLPPHQDDRPECLRLAECRHRRLWRGLRRNES